LESVFVILCCGDALIDFVPMPDVPAYQPCPGGSVYNVAVGLGRLQVPVGFFCKISTDFFGDMLIANLEKNGVDTTACIRSVDPTTLAFVSLSSEQISEPQFSFYANGSADRSLTVDELPSKLPEGVKILHFGSIALVMEPGASSQEFLMARESRTRIISLDPNVRPDLIADEQSYRRRFEKWVKSVDVLKLSWVDFEWIYKGEDFQDHLEKWFEKGVSLVILTKGEQGAEAFTKSGSIAKVSSPMVEVADTVGAGDAFLAAALAHIYLTGLLDRSSLARMSVNQLTACLSYAIQAAAINCTRVGADPPYLHEMEVIDG
jgi:fructokinase